MVAQLLLWIPVLFCQAALIAYLAGTMPAATTHEVWK